MTELKIGATVYRFDGDYRVYKRNEAGRQYGGPIYREHFRPIQITGETSRSWVLADGAKISKKTLPGGIYPDQEAIDRACWVNEHRYAICRQVERVRDYETLRALADLVGYEETTL